MGRKRTKILCIAIGSFFTLLFIGIVTLAFALDSIIKRTVESVGPKMTGTDFTIEEVDIRLLSGFSRLKQLEIANPDGYTEPYAMRLEEAVLDIHAGTFGSDKLVIEKISVIGPEISFEGSSKSNNLQRIGENIAAFVGSRAERNDLDRRLQVDHFLLSNAKVHIRLAFLGHRPIRIVLPTVELRDLGKNEDGITSAELTERIVKAISAEIWRTISQQAATSNAAPTESSSEQLSN